MEDLAGALRVRAKGLLRAEAAVELLIGHGSWLSRADFLDIAVESGRSVVSGGVLAVVDFEAAVTALDAGRLPCSGGEGRVLRVAASIADGVCLDLGAALSGLDHDSVALVAAAVWHAGGFGAAMTAAGGVAGGRS